MSANPRIDSDGDLPVDSIKKVQTAADGTSFTALPDVERARTVRIVNPVADIEVRRVGETDSVKVSADGELVIFVAQNASELEVRRVDTATTQVDVPLLIGVY